MYTYIKGLINHSGPNITFAEDKERSNKSKYKFLLAFAAVDIDFKVSIYLRSNIQKKKRKNNTKYNI